MTIQGTPPGCRVFGTGQATTIVGNTTFVVPADITKIKIHTYAPGGGAAYLGGSGAGGGYASCSVNVTPGSCCCIVVGVGGIAGNTTSFNGTNGGFTCGFGACATGGGGGRSYLCCTTQATVNAAAGGTGTGAISYSGGTGSCCVWGGAGGAATRIGPGGTGGNVIQGGGGGAGAGAGNIAGGSAFGPGTATVGGPDSSGLTTCNNARAYGSWCDDPKPRYHGELILGGGGGCLGGIGGIGGGSGGRGGCCVFTCGTAGNMFGGASGGIRCGAAGGIGAGGTSSGFCLTVSCMYGGAGSPYTFCSNIPLTHSTFNPTLGCARDSCNSSIYTLERARLWCPQSYGATCSISGYNIGAASLCYCAGTSGQTNTICCGWNFRQWLWSDNSYYTGIGWEKSLRTSQCCFNCTLTRNDGFIYRLYIDRCYIAQCNAHEDCCLTSCSVSRCTGTCAVGWRLAAGIIPACFTQCNTGLSTLVPTFANECSRTLCEITGMCGVSSGSMGEDTSWNGASGSRTTTPIPLLYNISSCDCTINVFRRGCTGCLMCLEQIALCNGNACVCRSINPFAGYIAVYDAATGNTVTCLNTSVLVGICDQYGNDFSGWRVCGGSIIQCVVETYSVTNGYCVSPYIASNAMGCCLLGIGAFAQCRFYSKNCPSTCFGRVVITDIFYHCVPGVAQCTFSQSYIYDCSGTNAGACVLVKPMGGLSSGSVLWHYNKMLCNMPATCPDIWTMLLNRSDPTYRCQTWTLAGASAGITTDPTCNCYKGMTQWSCGQLGSAGCINYVTTPDPLSVRYLPTSNTFIAFEGGNCHCSMWYGWSCTLEGDWTWCCMCGGTGPCLVQWTCHASLRAGGDPSCTTHTVQRRTGRLTFPPSGCTAASGHLNLFSGDRVVMINSPCCDMGCFTAKCFYRCCLYVTNNIQCFACWCKYTFPCCGTGQAVYVKEFDRFYVTHLGGQFSYSNRSADGAPVFTACCIATASIPFCDQQCNSNILFAMEFQWNRLCCKQFGSCLGCDEISPLRWNSIRHYDVISDCCGWDFQGVCHESPAMFLRTFGTCYGFGITTNGTTFGWQSLVPQDPNTFHVVGGANSTIMISPTPGCNHAYFYNGNTTVTNITSTCFATTCGCRNIMHHDGNFFMWDRYCIRNSVHLTANNTTGTLSACATWVRPTAITTLTTGVCEVGPTQILCTQNCSGQTCFLMVRQPTSVLPYSPTNATCTMCCVQLARSSDLCNWTSSCTTLCHTGQINMLAFDVDQMVAHYDPCYDLTFLGAPGQFIAVNNNLTGACQLRCTMCDPVFYPNGLDLSQTCQCFSCITTINCNCFNCWMNSMLYNHCSRGLCCDAIFYRCRGAYAVCPQSTGNGGAITAWPYAHVKYFVPDCDFTDATAPRYIFNKVFGPSVVATYCTCTCVFTLQAKPQNYTAILPGTIATCAHNDYSGPGGNGIAVIEY